MADFSALKAAIQTAIKTNGNEEITGSVLQNILLSIVTTMGDSAINGLTSALNSETTNRQNEDGALQTLIGTINTKLAEGYVYAGIATSSTNPGTPTGKVFYIATTAGTYTNFGGLAVTQGINILKFNGTAWSQEQVLGIDDEPTADSPNLVKSGGVQKELALGAVYDVSAKNPTAGTNNDGKWESLSALLSDANLNTLIPTAYRKGGMSIKFVQSSDNKYVQYRLMSDTFNTTSANWQGVDDEPTAGSQNLVKSEGVYNQLHDLKILNISSRQQFISGYATAAGVFTNIGGSSQDGFRYIPVGAGKTYRLVGSYLGNATGKANIVFSESIPSTGGSCTVITHDQAVATPFDIKYQATENGYLCIYINAVNYAYTFYLSDDELITDELSDNIKGIEDNIYSEDGKAVSSTFLTGNISNGVARNIGASVAYGFSYIPVIKGHKYHISGTFLNTAGTYAGIAFSESVIATNDAVVVVDMGIASGTINYSYEAQLNGYLYVYSTDAVFVEYGKDIVFLNKSDILSFCKQQPMDIVGKVYQKKFVSTSTSKIVDTTSASAGSYVIPVTAGQRYLVRGRVVAYTQYALIAFTEALSAGTTAKIILAASEASNNYVYTQGVEIAKNGYLMVWSTLDAYGSANYVEILPLLERITVDNDYYLPNALKIQTFGDSITDASWGDKSSWVSYLPDNVPIQSLTIVNCGIGGENIPNLVNVIQNGGTNQGGESVPALQTDTELVVLLIGTNDWSAGIQLETSKNALTQVFQYIINNSKAKILFCTPTQRTFSGTAVNAYGEKLNANNISLREFCNGLIEVCNVYSVPVLNLNADANINSLNIMDYSQDGLHPNRNGDIRISNLICKKIKEMIRH